MRNLLIITQFELTRLLLTRRGLVSVLAFVLVWFAILRYAIYPASRFLAESGSGGLLNLLLGEIELQHLAEWSVPELSVYWLFALTLLPVFCVVLTADQTASDRARGTLRFLHLRATRATLYFGRFAGQMLIQALLIAVTISSTLLLAWLRDPAVLLDGWAYAGLVVTNLFLMLLPYTALMAVVSILSRSARQATAYAVIVWILGGLLLRWLQVRFPDVDWLNWVMPGSQIGALMGLQDGTTLTLAPIPLAQTLVLLLIGWGIVRRIDL